MFPTVWTGRNRDDPTWAEGVSQVLCFSMVEVCIQITTVARSDIQNQHLLAIPLQLGTHDKRGRRLFLCVSVLYPIPREPSVCIFTRLRMHCHGIRIPGEPVVYIFGWYPFTWGPLLHLRDVRKAGEPSLYICMWYPIPWESCVCILVGIRIP